MSALHLIFPRDERDQQLRLKRFFLGMGAYVMNMGFVLACWWLGYFSSQTVTTYVLIVLAINVLFFSLLRSGWNKRFKDPSLTFAQMALATLTGIYLMYFAKDFRTTFLMLGVAMFVFGMFRFKTRDFAFLAAFNLVAYGGLIMLLAVHRPEELNLEVEIVQWMALFVTLAQFTFLAGYIGNLRSKVREKKQELEKRNQDLETALRQISDMAIRDELTGVYNRRYIMERIGEETQRCIRNGSVFTVCLIDIDLFKRINDTYGHLAGDLVLQSVAEAASGALRQTDFFGRFGGEEFIMVLTDTTAEGARITAERVRQKVEQLTFPDISPELRVTVSIGIAEHVRRTEPLATFKSADDALYEAKENGRNRCVVGD